jgi:hypothetical protein
MRWTARNNLPSGGPGSSDSYTTATTTTMTCEWKQISSSLRFVFRSSVHDFLNRRGETGTCTEMITMAEQPQSPESFSAIYTELRVSGSFKSKQDDIPGSIER